MHPLPNQSRPVRCAIYARKSAKTGLDKDVNSLAVQRDICSAYVRSQRHRGWCEVPENYEDGGFGGGNLNRPGLTGLLNAIEQGLVDVVVIYKLDRLTRSLSDFIRLADLFDQYEVTFVSVTQSFDTQDSLGRLVLNILLTFAQFEREMLSDRIRDKSHALRRAGRWIGGAAPYGYDLVNRRLVVNETEAAKIREIHRLYLELGSSNQVTLRMAAEGMRSKQWVGRSGRLCGGFPVTRTFIYGILARPAYIGEFHVDGEVIRALHEPLIDRETWEAARRLKESRKLKLPPVTADTNLLLGFLFDDLGRQMVMWPGTRQCTLTSRRYYVSTSNHRITRTGTRALRATAADLEDLVRAVICAFYRDREDVSIAVHKLGYRDADTDKLIDVGAKVARFLETCDRRKLRRAWEALIERIEISRERVRIILRCEQVRALLAWSGRGGFRRAPNPDARHHHIYVLESEAFTVRAQREFRLPINTAAEPGKPKRGLVDLMAFARRAQTVVYENRSLTFEQIAKRLHCRQPMVMRALRLNYLAPDIIAAIVDGRQPADLTRRKLLNTSIPMDWVQQRALLGFPCQTDPGRNEERY
ncbi:recombinase family protein [Sphingomonas psychrotolerans]|uniref:Recombinase family protein n=1 Tax=Sphingomonas psychrotolerans TaxID=1327635 RepID=A0ABU3N7P0_9SPHN|nr:recombinase family protein [Sphingomonas psychrotolerans]MDT8760519.1 recombinase family protein [Sphingomonas psychrotolerans]